MMTYVAAVLCVLGLAAGQILFKVSAGSLAAGSSLLSMKTLVPLLSAMCLYGITSLAWIWILRTIELGRVYPLMALAFVFVPLGSYLFFHERFGPQYYAGVVIIVIGIVVAVRA